MPDTPRNPEDIVLIMGMPRSGTTWLAKIFDSHPDTLYRHEPDAGRPAPPHDAGDAAVRAYVASLVANRSTRCTTKAPWFPKSYDTLTRRTVRPVLLRAMRVLSRVWPQLAVPDFAPRSAALRPVLKSVNISDLLGRVARAMPSVRGVGILRHPCGYASSILRGTQSAKFAGSTPVTENLEPFRFVLETQPAKERGLTLDAVRGLSPAARLGWLWVAYNDVFLASVDGLENVHLIRYEDLCADPPKVAKELFEFAQLGWNDQTAAFIGASTGHENASFYSVFKIPEKAAHRWREELTAEQIEDVMGVVRGTRAGAWFADDDKA